MNSWSLSVCLEINFLSVCFWGSGIDMTVILFAHAQHFQVTCRTHLTVSSHEIPHLSHLSASGTPQSLFIFPFCVPCRSLSVGLPLPVWGGAWYANAWLLCCVYCSFHSLLQDRRAHLETGLLYTAPAFLCAKDAPVAQSSLFKKKYERAGFFMCLSIYHQIEFENEYRGLDYNLFSLPISFL